PSVSWSPRCGCSSRVAPSRWLRQRQGKSFAGRRQVSDCYFSRRCISLVATNTSPRRSSVFCVVSSNRPSDSGTPIQRDAAATTRDTATVVAPRCRVRRGKLARRHLELLAAYATTGSTADSARALAMPVATAELDWQRALEVLHARDAIEAFHKLG